MRLELRSIHQLNFTAVHIQEYHKCFQEVVSETYTLLMCSFKDGDNWENKNKILMEKN